MKDPILWMHCTSPELGELAKKNAVVLIPVGAVEQHGPHMAVGCDCYTAGWLAERTARALEAQGIPAVVAPTLTVANSLHHMNFPGTMGNNWVWRAVEGSFSDALAERILALTKLYGR